MGSIMQIIFCRLCIHDVCLSMSMCARLNIVVSKITKEKKKKGGIYICVGIFYNEINVRITHELLRT